jgi:hypothetical protein
MVANDELGSLQIRLNNHFSNLHRLRIKESPDRQVFALEHGLSMPEIQMLKAAVRADIANKEPSWEQRLPWIVYAAEIGYGFTGDEYWQTFEQKTPGWVTKGDRYWIRDCFRSFQKEFGGAVPRGAWAEHFCIICWPIIHAILPLDLQRQLARILYELRHSFSAELFESPTMLGEIIAARSWMATSRFQNLAQETRLVGQIATALLLKEESDTGSLIHPATLKRIGEDLTRERQAREWLNGARRSAQERTQVRGLTLGNITSPIINHPERARAEVEALGIEPRLMLTPTDTAGISWAVSIEIPDLTHLLTKFPHIREILIGSRCKVAGSSRGLLARGQCLCGVQRIPLARWPSTDEVLLQFEQKDPFLEYILRFECLLRPSPTRLFRIASDGLAYECRSLRVRPGQKYILIRDDDLSLINDCVSTINLSCEGIHGWVLDMPPAIDTGLEKILRKIGLDKAKTIEVWPAGLASVVWDGEGHGEWFAFEQPCLAISSDHPIDALIVSISLSTAKCLEIKPITPGVPVFIALPKLPVGLHTIQISARNYLYDETEALGNLNVMMRIREARPWSQGMNRQGPIFVQMDPIKPTLEQLWEGRMDLTLNGPIGRQVECSISFFEKDESVPVLKDQLQAVRLPITSDDWRDYFEKSKTMQARTIYDTARSCEIEFRGEELGVFNIRFEREFTPLRWALIQDAQFRRLRLLNDSEKIPELTYSSFELPCIKEQLEPAQEYQLLDTGGLYSAEVEKFTTAIIIPPKHHVFSMSPCNPQIYGELASVESIIRNLSLARFWGLAKLPGDQLSTTCLQVVLRAITRQIMRLICGENWASAEAAILKSNDWLAQLNCLKKLISKQEIGDALEREMSSLVSGTREFRIKRMTQLAKSFAIMPIVPLPQNLSERRDALNNILNPQWIVELALRIASDPIGTNEWAGENLQVALAGLLETSILARAARYLVIVTDRRLQSQVAHGALYASWGWK